MGQPPKGLFSFALITIISEFRGGRVKFSWWGCGHGNERGVTVLVVELAKVPRSIGEKDREAGQGGGACGLVD